MNTQKILTAIAITSVAAALESYPSDRPAKYKLTSGFSKSLFYNAFLDLGLGKNNNVATVSVWIGSFMTQMEYVVDIGFT
jgi:hypothetical protein